MYRPPSPPVGCHAVSLEVLAKGRSLCDVALELGLRGEATMVVTADNTALAQGTGDVEVLSTPALLQLMQQATMAAMDGHLDDGVITAGLRVNVDHLHGSPIDAVLYAVATLTRIEGRRLVFEVEANSDGVIVGLGRIVRVRIDREQFLSRL